MRKTLFCYQLFFLRNFSVSTLLMNSLTNGGPNQRLEKGQNLECLWRALCKFFDMQANFCIII